MNFFNFFLAYTLIKLNGFKISNFGNARFDNPLKFLITIQKQLSLIFAMLSLWVD